MKTELKPEFKERLVKAKVLTKWENNRLSESIVSPIKSLNEEENFSDFIGGSFIWDNTPDRYDFWSKISKL